MTPTYPPTSWKHGVCCGLVLAACVLAGCGKPAVQTLSFETGPLLIDRIYHSMDGPHERMKVEPAGMDWITAYRTEVLDSDSGRVMGHEFFCHSQLQLSNLTRLLVTATGSENIVFPKDFGLPLTEILAGIPNPDWKGVSVLGMVLNNYNPTMHQLTRVRASVDYLSAAQAKERGLKRLFKVELPLTVQPAPGEAPEMVHGGEACVLVGGLKSHWLVPQGRQVTTKRYRDIVPVDATVHFVSAHLHNHGVSLKLTDVTDGNKVLWQTNVEYEPARRQILHIPEYASEQGFPIYKDHEYEIEAVYDNEADHPIDAMAVFYIYYHPLQDVTITYPFGPPDGADPIGMAG